MAHYSNWISQQFGRFASKTFTPWFQKIINRTYVRLMDLEMCEFERAESYQSLNALFTRHLKAPRTFSSDASDMIAPCDALVSERAQIDGALAMQIKGMHYNVDALLGTEIDEASRKRVRGGDYINFYLSPRDYHRYHIPCDTQILKAVYIPGKLYPVNMPALRNIASLFVENERVVLECESAGKRFFMVMVGALNVGKMQIAFEPQIQTNATVDTVQCYTYENLWQSKGDDFGCFEMGSTIVILSEKGLFEYQVSCGEKVRYGETIATIAAADQA